VEDLSSNFVIPERYMDVGCCLPQLVSQYLLHDYAGIPFMVSWVYITLVVEYEVILTITPA
jgi:hypothetical protein